MKKVHLLTSEDAINLIDEKITVSTVCGEKMYPSIKPHEFLTIREYITENPFQEEEIPSISYAAIEDCKKRVCLKCEEHEDLPLLTLKDL